MTESDDTTEIETALHSMLARDAVCVVMSSAAPVITGDELRLQLEFRRAPGGPNYLVVFTSEAAAGRFGEPTESVTRLRLIDLVDAFGAGQAVLIDPVPAHARQVRSTLGNLLSAQAEARA